MIVEECPHCNRTVLPSAERDCPACHRSLDDLEGVDVTRTRATLRVSMKLPQICCDCDEPTDQIEHVVLSRTVGGSSLWEKAAVFAFMIPAVFVSFGLFRSLGSLERGHVDLIKLAVPRCEGCRARGVLRPEHTDFENRSATFMVNRCFAERLRGI